MTANKAVMAGDRPEPMDVFDELAVLVGGERGTADRPLAWRIAALVVVLAIVGGLILGVTTWG